MQVSHSDFWLHDILPRLQAYDFVPLDAKTYTPGIKFALRRTRFELTKCGMAETFLVFAEIPELTPQLMTYFSAAAFQLALSSSIVPLPRGFFEAVICFPVAITSNLDPRMAEWIKRTTPTKHWAACEMPVAFDTVQRSLVFFEQTPMWGAAYFSGFRKQIQQLLGQ